MASLVVFRVSVTAEAERSSTESSVQPPQYEEVVSLT